MPGFSCCAFRTSDTSLQGLSHPGCHTLFWASSAWAWNGTSCLLGSGLCLVRGGRVSVAGDLLTQRLCNQETSLTGGPRDLLAPQACWASGLFHHLAETGEEIGPSSQQEGVGCWPPNPCCETERIPESVWGSDCTEGLFRGERGPIWATLMPTFFHNLPCLNSKWLDLLRFVARQGANLFPFSCSSSLPSLTFLPSLFLPSFLTPILYYILPSPTLLPSLSPSLFQKGFQGGLSK